MEIIFYCINSDINLFLFQFIYQLVNKNSKKILLLSNSETAIEKLDDLFWENCKDTMFLSHSVYNKNNKNDECSLLLTTEEVNANNANFLVISKFLNNDFIKNFEKVFFVFTNSNQNSLNKAKEAYNEYKKYDYNIKIISKAIDGNWKEFTNFENI